MAASRPSGPTGRTHDGSRVSSEVGRAQGLSLRRGDAGIGLSAESRTGALAESARIASPTAAAGPPAGDLAVGRRRGRGSAHRGFWGRPGVGRPGPKG